LFTSPLYLATQWYVPGAVTVKGSDVDVAVTGSSALVEENTSTVHAGSLNSSNVTVPVARTPNVREAVSRSWAPTTAARGSALVAMTGLALSTVTCSRGSAHKVGPAGLLLASPL